MTEIEKVKNGYIIHEDNQTMYGKEIYKTLDEVLQH